MELAISILRASTDQSVAECGNRFQQGLQMLIFVTYQRGESRRARRPEREGGISPPVPRYNCNGCAEQ
jgi:hypothetical protein